MSVPQKILATRFRSENLRTRDNVSIVVVSKDNRSFCINVVGCRTAGDPTLIPNSVILSEQPLENFSVLSRVAVDSKMSLEMFDIGEGRIIANSLADKLKTYTILRELVECVQ